MPGDDKSIPEMAEALKKQLRPITVKPAPLSRPDLWGDQWERMERIARGEEE